MKISDILGMSLTNLWRRKMRTFLTVLGVIIGTASIVCMLSLGIGMKQAMMESVGSAGGLTDILVESDEDTGSELLLLDDSTIEKFMQLEYVESVEPQLWYSMPVQTGNYEGYIEVIGVSQEYLEKIELGEGTLPEKGANLSIIAGNQVIMNFMDRTTGEWPDYESGEAPNIDLMKSPLIGGIEVEESYSDDSYDDLSGGSDYIDPTFSDTSADDFSTEESDFSTDDSDSDDSDDSDDFNDYDYDDYYEDEIYSSFTSSTKRVQLNVSGVTMGDMETYTEYSYYCYTDIDMLKEFLKKNYGENAVVPGQPTDSKGKPYRDLKYSQLVVKVDDSTNVETVLEEIQTMGYRAETNKEWLESIEQQYLIIEAVLGGIGAVAMFVAAISIANTMTMSTYERTKEIGVMKVLGCSLNNIRTMFLTEAACIGFLGGAAGIILSYTLSFAANKLIAPLVMSEEYGAGTNISVIPLWLVGSAIIFSTIVGMLAGFFPAQRATKLSPLAAIRND